MQGILEYGHYLFSWVIAMVFTENLLPFLRQVFSCFYVNHFFYMGVKKKDPCYMAATFLLPMCGILFWNWLDVETYNSF